MVHLSEFHFQRLFTRWAGVSPKRFLQFLTVEHAKRRLAESKSVLETTLDSGLSGPGRLHDLFVSVEAVTPGEYKTRGSGIKIGYGFGRTPFGLCLLGITARGICWLSFVERGREEEALRELKTHWSGASISEKARAARELCSQLFSGTANSARAPLSLLLSGTNFQIQVWKALLRIPVGNLVSYESIGESIGAPKASRAIGSAVGQNAIAYLVPCHRVIRKTGLILLCYV